MGAACAAPPPEQAAAPVGVNAVANWRMVDLSHAYGGNTLYWPTDTKGLALDTLAEGMTEAGYFHAAKEFATAEHGGTHLDAPVHFAEGDDVASIALDRLILPGIVVDVSEQAAADPDYLVTAEDVLAWEERHGPVPVGSAVLIRTGWASRRPDALAYLDDDTPGDASNLHFPGVDKQLRSAVKGPKHPNSTAKIYDGPEHGLPMFAKNADLEPALISWLKTELKGK